MKYEQKVQFETSEYICFVKRIDGVVAQKTLEQELIRCKDCKHFTGKWCILNSRKEFDPEDRLVNGEGFCAWAERKDE